MKASHLFLCFLCSGLMLYGQSTSSSSGHTQAIKVDLLSQFLGYIGVNYERKITDNWGLEGNLGIIGIGDPLSFSENIFQASEQTIDNGNGGTYQRLDTFSIMRSKRRGSFLRLGVKIYLEDTDELRGKYLYPHLFYTHLLFDSRRINSHHLEDGRLDPQKASFNYAYTFDGITAGIALNAGYQFVWDRLTLDLKAGLGYARNVDRHQYTNFLPDQAGREIIFGTPDINYRFSHIGHNLSFRRSGDPGQHVIVNAGVALGLAF
ncbi:MAG: hypothetical protein AAF587_06075 [Bacteroidota bacterium]